MRGAAPTPGGSRGGAGGGLRVLRPAPHIPAAITGSPAAPRRGGAGGARAGARARTLPSRGAPRAFRSWVPGRGRGAARGAPRRRRRRARGVGAALRRPPCSGAPGRVGSGPSGSRGPGRGVLGRLSAAGAAGAKAAGMEAGAPGRAGRTVPGGRAAAPARKPSCCRCCSPRSLAADWLYSPGIRPALPSSRRQPPRGKPTLPRPWRLPTARVRSPCPAPDPGEPCLPGGGGTCPWWRRAP